MPTREHAVATDVQTVAITLTNAEIKALPTTPVVILDDPGAGRLIVPIAAVGKASTTTPYTNVHAKARLSLFRGSVEQLGIGVASAPAGDALEDAGTDGGALTLRADNHSAGNFTGGNAASGYTVTVWFSVLSI